MKAILFALLFFCSIGAFSQENPTLKLWYNKPAEKWVEALPLGNGRIGAMVFGGIEEELIQLNESTLWSGGPVRTNVNPEAKIYLPQIRKALLEDEDYTKANQLTRKMQGFFSQSYLPLGDILIKQNFNGSKPDSYYRDLNLNEAVATTRFTVNGVQYTREIFTSAPDNVMLVRISANKKGALNLDISAKSLLKNTLSVNGSNELILKGKAPANVNPSYYNPKERDAITYEDTAGCNGMRYQYRIRAISKDGLISASANSGIHVEKASEVVLYVAAATSFNGFDKCPDKDGKDETRIVSDLIAKAVKKDYNQLYKLHVADFNTYFVRVEFAVIDSTSAKPNN